MLMLCFLFSCRIFGQEPATSHISLRAMTAVSAGAYFMDIFDKGNRITVVYKFKESVSRNAEGDSEIIRTRNSLLAMKTLNPGNDTVKGLITRMDSLYQTYTSYSADSISLAYETIPEYVALFHRVMSVPAETLENRLQNQNRIVLDGTDITCTLMCKGVTKLVWAHSPRAESHPLLYELITETLDLYRTRSNKLLITRQRTFGY